MIDRPWVESAMSEATSLDLQLAGIANFRDFGGQATPDGRRVARGRLFRSGHHADATEADLASLSDLELSLVVDLRRPAERQRLPSRRPQPFSAEVIEHQGPLEAAMPPHLAFLAMPDVSADEIIEQMTSGYRGYPFDPHYVQVYRAYFARLAGAGGPVLIHCHAGKDRTGFLAALTLKVLGVDDDVILADYLATNRHNRADERIPALARDFQRDHGKPVSEALLRQVMRAEAAYLDAALDAIRSQHGTVEAYLSERLGVPEAARLQIQSRYLETA
jgi:protein tyrosine/serine phosphatase